MEGPWEWRGGGWLAMEGTGTGIETLSRCAISGTGARNDWEGFHVTRFGRYG